MRTAKLYPTTAGCVYCVRLCVHAVCVAVLEVGRVEINSHVLYKNHHLSAPIMDFYTYIVPRTGRFHVQLLPVVLPFA